MRGIRAEGRWAAKLLIDSIIDARRIRLARFKNAVIIRGMNEAPVTRNANVMHGTPCFAGTRVPVRSLFDHLEGGYTVEYFLEEFPSVAREQVMAVLDTAKNRAESEAVEVSAAT